VTPEGALKADAVNILNGLIRYPEFYLRLNSGKVRVRGGWMVLCPEGTADFVVHKRNRTIWLELKTGATQKERALKQAAFREQVMLLGHQHAQCTTVDDVIKAMGE
jgi:hypothetical protein